MDDSSTGGDTIAEADAASEVTGHTAPLRIGQAERYLLKHVLGKGGMGEVLAATDEQIGREVAVKRMLRPNSSERALLRFFREASIQGRLDHPAIVPVHELGIDDDGRPFFVMKKLAGTSMATMIDTNANRTRLLRAFCEVCLAVEFAHTRGVVHRDIKPDNVLLGEFGEVYVIDWGVAKIAEDAEPELSSDDKLKAKLEISTTDASELQTAYGVAVGTPGYMSPEQVRGSREVDGRADVYSLGCILFEILTGQMMHPRGDAGMQSALAGEPMKPSVRTADREIPPELDALVLHATAPDKLSRLQTARELGERVQLYLDGDRDIALRTQLATQHLVAAKEAFVRAERDVSARAVAMREAGRALALDPKLGGAADVLTRLMLEPPETTPPEVEQELLADRIAEVARHSKTGMRGFIGYLALAPLLLATSHQVWYALALVACVAFNCAVLLQKATASSMRWRAPVLAVANATMLVMLARMFSPFLLAPGIAVVTGCALVYGPAYENRRHVMMMATLLTAAILLPALGETLGWFPHTVALVDGGIQLTGPALQAGDTAKTIVLVLSVGAMIFSGSLMSFRMCSADRALRRKMQLQAWQLRQLVPEQARAATAA